MHLSRVVLPLPVLRGLTLDAPAGEITVLLGKSGCGKTTVLRLTGGLEPPDGGEIRFGEARRTGFVFQEPRLMPWLTVWKNVAFGLRKEEIRPEEITEIIRTVNLQGFEKAYPEQLSGGMRHRVAIARALAIRPSFLLMDEPFAALDHFTREMMQRELLAAHRKRRAGILFVTHSLDEALALANRIAVIAGGVVAREFRIPGEQSSRNLLDDEFIALKRDILRCLDRGGNDAAPMTGGETPLQHPTQGGLSCN